AERHTVLNVLDARERNLAHEPGPKTVRAEGSILELDAVEVRHVERHVRVDAGFEHRGVVRQRVIGRTMIGAKLELEALRERAAELVARTLLRVGDADAIRRVSG